MPPSWLWESAFSESVKRAGVAAKITLGKKNHLRVVNFLKQHPLPGNLRDLFHLAYYILAGRSDPLEPLSPSDAVEYGLDKFRQASDMEDAAEDAAREVARSFSSGESLDVFLKKNHKLHTSMVEQEMKAYMARELRRLARERKVSVAALCDVTERTIRGWAKK